LQETHTFVCTTEDGFELFQSPQTILGHEVLDLINLFILLICVSGTQRVRMITFVVVLQLNMDLSGRLLLLSNPIYLRHSAFIFTNLYHVVLNPGAIPGE
jgi:hypothetical protein